MNSQEQKYQTKLAEAFYHLLVTEMPHDFMWELLYKGGYTDENDQWIEQDE